MPSMLVRLLWCLALTLWISQPVSSAQAVSDWSTKIAQGIAYRQAGNIQQSIELLTTIRAQASSPEMRAVAAGELGISLLRTHQYDAAEAALKDAYSVFPTGKAHAHYALHLGTLALALKQNDEARRYYQEALTFAGNDLDTQLSVELNLTRLAPADERLAKLSTLSRQLTLASKQPNLTRYHLNLGHQALLLGRPGSELAYRHLDLARKQAVLTNDNRLQVDALDDLAQLYEDHGRAFEAQQLTREAIAVARSHETDNFADRLINLEWRQGRLQKAQGHQTAALAAYQRAVEHIEATRQDIPIENEDGLSTFSQTLEPIFLGYIDLLLQQADSLAEPARSNSLRRAIDSVEMIRQTELQDFLGDRCAVETVQGGIIGHVPAGVGILYPVILQNRLELLLDTPAGIIRRTSPVKSSTLRNSALTLAEALRFGTGDYLAPAQHLYAWLLAPFDEVIAEQQLQNLVVVSADALRLIPMAALHDGQRYAVEKYALSVVTGMSLTNSSAPLSRTMDSLVAGVAVPGPVVEKLAHSLVATILEPGTLRSRSGLAMNVPTRAMHASPSTAAEMANRNHESQQRELEDLRASLALPGVKIEIDALNTILKGKTQFDAGFTVGQFQHAMRTDDYRIVHIASHGVFGDSAESSFIMAYDDVLSLNSLQSLLRSEKFQDRPIELLGLSACQTAEGNDRAPLGISGAAIKARAKSVLGTLWPIADDAAQAVMTKFYSEIAHHGQTKTEALRQAQLELLRQPKFSHPFYWAPFVLIGNWL